MMASESFFDNLVPNYQTMPISLVIIYSLSLLHDSEGYNLDIFNEILESLNLRNVAPGPRIKPLNPKFTAFIIKVSVTRESLFLSGS